MFRRRALLAAAILAAAGLTAAARGALEPAAGTVGKVRDPAWLPDGRLLRAASVGNRLILADLYWLRFVQYVGETVMTKSERWDALFPLADITTDLDPRFGYAYQVAGSNLSGLAHRYAEADRILLKGMRNVPDRWSLPLVYATNKFLYEQSYAEAARYARRAAEVGRKPHLALLAANLSALANTDDEYGAALEFLDEAMQQAGTPELKDELAARIVKIRTYQVLAALEKAIAAFEQATSRRPATLQDALGPGRPVPPDPSGGRLEYDPSTGKVRSTLIGERAPLRVTP